VSHYKGLLCPHLQPVTEAHRNPWFTVNDRGGFFTAEPNEPQIVVLPVVEEDSIVLVKVRRPVVGDVTWELPGGGCNEGESGIQAAQRELAEETGICVKDLSKFVLHGEISVDPNRHPVHHKIFQVNLTRTNYKSRQNHDSEIEEVGLFHIDEIINMITTSMIYVALPCAVISRFFLRN
jgi:8-oxo-dGTP pyrophosphatase MutT (NUDIX family)